MTTLRSIISQTVESSDVNDPRELAKVVADATPAELVESFFRETLVAEVRTALAEKRNRAMTHALNPARSRKVSGIRDWWAEMLASRVFTADGWVTLGDCGAAELKFAADQRRQDAERELARAKSYDQLRSLLRQHRVSTVAELPTDAARDSVIEVAA